MDKLQIEMKNQEQQLEDVDAARRKITVSSITVYIQVLVEPPNLGPRDSVLINVVS